ncbi:type III secretion system inner rod subunit SctI [Herbaspirillum sp. RTI4]|uniref:type III secretion system inner rod subunit SctI n=1 Tax=Herbaspirillum sp. RTI4 TaxID=3048640 RepID=UPI002AB35578|nr:type III secretion system inner rod subunit SctI [Herbaspirillum sp. RTI4]MDY7578354.1 type III secretion system inner rod subunit SctI [Herbaspirillum sp. RTI4]MEA9981153.1 type III secretion system inner rod subunit SctI [Herbaspirillum sp. RTI4]
MQITSLRPDISFSATTTLQRSEPISLESRAAAAIADIAVDSAVTKNAILHTSQTDLFNPKTLANLQVRVESYSNHVALISSLTHKAVALVETVVKS